MLFRFPHCARFSTFTLDFFYETLLLYSGAPRARAELHSYENLVIYPSEKFLFWRQRTPSVRRLFGGKEGSQKSARLGEEYVIFSWREIVRCICATRVFLGGKSPKKSRGHYRRFQKLVYFKKAKLSIILIFAVCSNKQKRGRQLRRTVKNSNGSN